MACVYCDRSFFDGLYDMDVFELPAVFSILENPWTRLCTLFTRCMNEG